MTFEGLGTLFLIHANATGTPITHMHEGKQYIVIAVMEPNYLAILVASDVP